MSKNHDALMSSAGTIAIDIVVRMEESALWWKEASAKLLERSGPPGTIERALVHEVTLLRNDMKRLAEAIVRDASEKLEADC